MSVYVKRRRSRRGFGRCRTEMRRVLSASLAIAASTSLFAPISSAAPEFASASHRRSLSAHSGLAVVALALGGPARAAVLAPHDTPVADAWLPEPPEVSFAPEPQPVIPTVDPDPAPQAETPLRAHCSPNPFATSTAVVFELPRTARVDLSVHDVGGREVRRLSDGESYAAGHHLVHWDGRDDFGREVESGTYTFRLRLER